MEVACWAHVRRKFYDIAVADPTAVCARQALERIRCLYAIEVEAHEMTAPARQALRQEKALPLLTTLKGELDTWAEQVLPKSALGKAIAYTRKLWTALLCYVDHGQLEIDNNRAERAIRPLVVGRHNWTFAGSHQGAANAATVYSLIETCKAHGVEPYEYVADVLERLPSYPINRIEELLPWNWKGPPTVASVAHLPAKAA